MSNNIYDILGKLKGLLPTETPVETAKEPVYENVEPRGDIMEAVKSLEEKYMGFKKTVAAVKKGGSAEDPEAVAASIGRKKYGKAAFQKAAAAGKKLGEGKEEYCDACDSTECHCEEVKEDAKPDFLDLDKDGDTEEPMKQAAKDAKDAEPAKPDSDAVAKRKRLQALKDKQEEEKDDDWWDKEQSTSNVTRHYAKYQDEPETDDLEEVAPPGAKAERMVKHIKKGYAKDGKLTDKEKSIAYATAWKAHNKGQVEEGRPSTADKITKDLTSIADKKGYKSTKDFTSKDWDNVAKPHGFTGKEVAAMRGQKLKESAMMEASSYTYEKVADILSAEQPHLDVNGKDFQKAVYDQLIKMHLSPKSARWNVYYDEDFLSDCATAYAHNLKHGQEHEPVLDAVQELDEIARLAGLPTKKEATCEGCGCAESMCECGTMDESELGAIAGGVAGAVLGKSPAAASIGSQIGDKLTGESADLEEEEMDEGNEFTKARLDAIAQGKDTFTVGGKVHKVTGDTSQEKHQVESTEPAVEAVTEDININVTANGEEDVVNLIRQLAGMPRHADTMGEEVVEEERDIEWDNTPEEQTAPLSAAIPSGNDLHKSKKQDPATANKAANPLEDKKVEESLWKAYEDIINDVKA